MTFKNGTIELTVETEKITYVLSAFLNLNEGYKKETPSLGFYKDYKGTDQECMDEWDSEHYIYNTLYKKVLIPWVSNKEIISGEDFANFVQISGVSLNDFEDLIELFERAEELGFFNK